MSKRPATKGKKGGASDATPAPTSVPAAPIPAPTPAAAASTEAPKPAVEIEAPQPAKSSFSSDFLKSEFVYHSLILGFIYILAFNVRLFSVLRFESMIHEFDPWFNFRSTKYLVREGFYNFHNWFDDMAWYPLGRFVGGTVYPGLMYTSSVLHTLLDMAHLHVNVRNVCVFLAPFMAGNTVIATYLLTKECWNGSAGIIAAAFISIAPGYISRSVAGSYDNECIAIFAMVNCFYLWVKSVRTGSMAWAAMAALAYFYMVQAWGGYIFLINIIPFHVLVLLLVGRGSRRLYVAYCTFYVLGTVLSMQNQFVQFQPVTSPEHLAAFGVFGLLQLHAFYHYLGTLLTPKQLSTVVRTTAIILAVGSGALVLLALTGHVPFLTGRLYSLLGATSNLAIIKSVSEHQPSPWSTFFFDLQIVVTMAPVGMYFCFMRLSDTNLFAALYVLFASYFTSIMVRLVLVLTPGACVLAGIGTSVTLNNLFTYLAPGPSTASSSSSSTASSDKKRAKGSEESSENEGEQSCGGMLVSKLVAVGVLLGILFLFFTYVIHCNWATATAYSSPSIVLQAHNHDGSVVIFDDFREAYTWLRHNTAPDAKIMSWWDYGYQITGMGNRTTIVDNNTRNNTHIATVGLAMASNEDRAYEVMRALDVDYVLVVFGGRIGYSSDDINKFLWMVRISGGVFPEVVESDYFNAQGQYRVDRSASKRMTDSLMYKLCYYRFAEQDYGSTGGYDRVRQTEIGVKDIQLQYVEEAFTTEHWMVRIYRVKKDATHPNFVDKIQRSL